MGEGCATLVEDCATTGNDGVAEEILDKEDAAWGRDGASVGEALWFRTA